VKQENLGLNRSRRVLHKVWGLRISSSRTAEPMSEGGGCAEKSGRLGLPGQEAGGVCVDNSGGTCGPAPRTQKGIKGAKYGQGGIGEAAEIGGNAYLSPNCWMSWIC